MSEITASEIIEQLDLEEHPEGGYFRETYRGNEKVRGEDNKERTAGTGIYFLLTEGICTNWHRVSSDEGKFQQLIPKNCWQRAYSTGNYTLVGCTVNPGFEFEDFEMIQRDKLANKFPDLSAEITRNPFA